MRRQFLFVHVFGFSMETLMRRFMPRRRRLMTPGATALVVLACLLTAARIGAQQQGQLYISVLDADNKPVTDLEPADINVVADDVDCKVVKLDLSPSR